MKRVFGVSRPSGFLKTRCAPGAFWRVLGLFDAERRERGTSGAAVRL